MQRKKGISLIVLVITIIVMIILAATIIIGLNNTNIMEKANEAVTKTDLATVTELANVAWGEAYASGLRTKDNLEDKVFKSLRANGVDLENKYEVTVTTSGVKVKLKKFYTWTQTKTTVTNGEGITLEVGQKLNNETGLPTVPTGSNGWYILGVENGKLLITTNANITTRKLLAAGETFVPISGGDYTTVEDGTWGWLTYLEKLDQDCTDIINVGGTVEKVRSVRVEDINRVTGYVPKVGTEEGDYGVEVNVTGNYPDKITPMGLITTNFYNYYPTTLTDTNDLTKSVGISQESYAYTLLFNSGNYWLASSFVQANGSNFALLGIRSVSSGRVSSGCVAWFSINGSYSNQHSAGIRPAVTLSSDFLPEV